MTEAAQTICGYVHENPLPEDFIYPRCKKPASVFVKLEEEGTLKANPWEGAKTGKNLAQTFVGCVTKLR